MPGRTLLAQQEGVEAQMVDRQVKPALPRDSSLPVAAGVIIHQLLLIRHPEQPPHLQLRLPKLPTVLLLFLPLLQPVLLCDYTLQEVTSLTHRYTQVEKQSEGDKQEVTYRDLPFDKGGDVFIIVEDGDGLQQVGLQPIPVLRYLLPG